jgi:hypothetical protein
MTLGANTACTIRSASTSTEGTDMNDDVQSRINDIKDRLQLVRSYL